MPNNDPDPDTTSNFDADVDPDPHLDPDLVPSFTHVGKSDFFGLLFAAVPVYTVLSFSSAAKVSSDRQALEADPAPDPAKKKKCRFERIRIHHQDRYP